MCLRFGFGPGGRPDTTAAATAMGVSRRTIQRWLHARHGRSMAHIPPARLDQLITLLAPSEETLAAEAVQLAYARKALAKLDLPHGMGILPSWKKQRWLEPHLVVILEIPVRHLKIRQVTVGRNTDQKYAEFAKRGHVLDHLIVPTRFHATVLTHRLLEQLGPWRFQAGASQVTQGFTMAWFADAPTAGLDGQLRDRRGRLVTMASQKPPTDGEWADQQPAATRTDPTMPRTSHPDYKVDPDRGSGAISAKKAKLVDTPVYVDRESERVGLRELDTMVEGMAGLNRLQKDRERVFPRQTNAELRHPRMRRELPDPATPRRPLSARQRNARSKARRATQDQMPLTQLRTQRDLVTDADLWRSTNDRLSDHLGDLQDFSDAEQARIRRIDRSIQSAERRNDRGHVLYANMALPGYINASNVDGFIHKNFAAGRQFTFDRYTAATHQLHETRATVGQLGVPTAQVVTFEMETRRGAYLGQSDKVDNTGHLLPRGMEFEVVDVHHATYQDPAGKTGRCLVIQLRDVTPEP